MKRIITAVVNGGQRRSLKGKQRHLPMLISVLTAIWSVYQSIWSTIDVVSLTIVFLSLTVALTFIIYAPSKLGDNTRVYVVDYILAALALAGGVFFTAKVGEMATRIALFDPLSDWDIAFSSMLLLMLLESVRRTIGLTMCIIVLVLFSYNLFGNHVPGFLNHRGVSYLHYLDIAFFTTDGVFGTPLRVAATYGFLFVIFGTLLHRCGAGDFFYKLASSAGKRPGGPAKIAVISSGLFGSTSGNPVADVVTTGSITIPIMSRSGFTPKEAAGIEATACTGGTLMPPVMGAAAFIMAEFTAIPYRDIAAAALIPVFLYYSSLYIQVHFQAMYKGLKGSGDTGEPVLQVLRKDFLFIVPLVVLVYFLAQGYSPSMVAFSALVTVIITATLRKNTRMNFKVLYEQLAESTERVLPVAMACAAAGLVMGGITMTGLANKFGSIIGFVSSGNSWLALMTAAVITVFLGMGLPTSASYILASVLIAQILQGFGFDILQAHMFLLYFAALSAITPPVAIASFAAAAIARTDPIATSFAALRKATVVFMIPFAFAGHAPLLLEGTVPEIVIAAVLAFLGAVCISAAVASYILGKLQVWERVLMAVAGLLLLLFPIEWQLGGLVAAAVGLARNGLSVLRGDATRQDGRLIESTADTRD